MERPASSRSHSTAHIRDETRHPLAKACDQCHRCKVACDGERPTCGRCSTNSSACTYSTGKPIGKPKGSKNRSKLKAQRAVTDRVDSEPAPQPPANTSSSKRKTTAGASPGARQLSVGTPQISIHEYKKILKVYRTTSDSDRVFACHLPRVQMAECWNSSKSQNSPLVLQFRLPKHWSNWNSKSSTRPLLPRHRLRNSSIYNYHHQVLRERSLNYPLITISTLRRIGFLVWSMVPSTRRPWIHFYRH